MESRGWNMTKGKKENEMIYRSEVEFEEIYLPLTHEKKRREKTMREPKTFADHLKEELTKRVKI